jgi:outer membrane receptor protein involved in Fe transport
MGRKVRGNFGVRREFGRQDVISHDLFDPSFITSQGNLSNTDWLGGANVTWSVVDAVNVRAAASRTLSRPDLDELSPRPTVDYVGSWLRVGNPSLKRAIIENYDLRVEAFPSLAEVFAAGVFLKELRHPIETGLQGASGTYVLIPRNSESGRNVGVELEARVGLGRIHGALKPFSLNSNVSFISSHVKLDEITKHGSQDHPLQGQAERIVNASLTYQAARAGIEASVLVSNIGRRLVQINNAAEGIPDEYDPGITSLDATFGLSPYRGARLKFGASNLLDQRVRVLSGDLETQGYRSGRSFSIALAYGS